MATCRNSDTSKTRALVARPTASLGTTPFVSQGRMIDDDMPQILGWGIDTLYLSFDVHIGDQTWAKLEEEQAIAQALEEKSHTVHAPGWLNAIMRPHGAKGGYHFLIETDSWSIKLLRDTPNRPPVYVELRAFALRTHPGGVWGLCEDVCAYLRDVLLTDSRDETSAVNVEDARISRMDLFVDWQGGWHPTLTEGEQRLFIKPSRASWNPQMEGNACTGYTVGKGHVQARIYNKTIQAKKKFLEWYCTDLAQRNGSLYDPAQDVWRLEFELHRAGVTGFRIVTKQEIDDPDAVIEAELAAEDLPHIGTVGKALQWLGPVFAYLATRWLRVVVPNADENRARWLTHPTWITLRDAFVTQAQAQRDGMRGGQSLSEECLRLVRAERHSGYRRLLNRMVVGVHHTLALMESDPITAFVAWLEYNRRIAVLAQRQRVARAFYRTSWETMAERRADAYASRGMGGASERDRRWLMLLEATLGMYTSAGVARESLPQVSTVAELAEHLLPDMEQVALVKGGVGQMLHDKWSKVYKAATPGERAVHRAA
ncbi:MAG TPA: hypothetical protein VFN02_14905 [Ktedonobacteraceae bacterium]|nr:hypothetical protein [Ktedonobacteraceae bacterium]